MPIFNYTFSELNVSVQPGDIVYYTIPKQSQSGRNHPSANIDTKPRILGRVDGVWHSTKTIAVDTDSGGGCGNCTRLDGERVYLFFQKNHLANTSGIVGYYMDTELRNWSASEAEIFATAVDYVESSK